MASIFVNSDLKPSQLDIFNRKSFFVIDLQAGDRLDFQMRGHLLIFLLDGALQFSLDKTVVHELKTPSVFLVKRGTFYERTAVIDSRIVVLPIIHYGDISNASGLERSVVESKQAESAEMYQEKSAYIVLTPIVRKFFDLLINAMRLGITEDYYFDLKIKELTLIMEKEYSKEERTAFFSPIIGNEQEFFDFVYTNYKKVKNIKEFAALSNYSQTGFERKFHKIFGLTPAKWLRRNLAIDVYNELIKTAKPFKEISLDYGFSSPSHFNNFCKEALGGTPGELRKQVIIPEKFQIMS